MDGTETSIVFNQYAYDSSSPAPYDAGRITVGTVHDWRVDTAGSQHSYMAFHTASASTVEERMRITNSGNVGIGLTDPSYRLTLTSDSTIATQLYIPGRPAGTPYTSGGSMADGTYYYVITAVAGGETVQSDESFSITISGGGGSGSVDLTWTSSPGAESYNVYRTTTPGTYSSPSLVGNPTTNSYTDTVATPSSGAPPTTTNAYVNYISGTHAWSYLNAGHLGIGTRNPQTRLEVKDSTSPQFRITNTGSQKATFGVDTDGQLDITTNDQGAPVGAHINLIPDGNVGIGTTTPNAKLDVFGVPGSHFLRLSYDTSNYASYQIFNDGRMDIQTVGSDSDIKISTGSFSNAIFIEDDEDRVGIGTSQPLSELTIYGGDGQDNDAALTFDIGGTYDWYIGVDDGDADQLEIGIGSTVGTNALFTATQNGISASGQ
jgi:hypothetical protein